jgi:hypothetical protein
MIRIPESIYRRMVEHADCLHFIRLRRRPRLRAETHYGVQARDLPVGLCKKFCIEG